MRISLPRRIPKSLWLRNCIDLVYPRVCSLCNQTIVDTEHESICSGCFDGLRPTEDGCPHCSAPQLKRNPYRASTKNDCYYCEKRKWYFGRAYCFTAYAGAAARIARKIKQPTHEALAMEVGRLVGQWLAERSDLIMSEYDFCVPIPQHWMRRLRFRYNQADVLAEHIAMQLQIPVHRNRLFRSRWTEKQGTKSINERLVAVQDSFVYSSKASIKGSKVLLIDDIVTSGATASDAARALKAAGAKQVDVVAFARGVGAFEKKQSRHNKLSEQVDSPSVEQIAPTFSKGEEHG